MKVLSLFDGISAGRLALEKANIQVSSYYKAEIDKFANKVSENHYMYDLNFGDVSNWREWDIDWESIDLLIGGSPCQGFSFAGKQLAFDDPRSSLFFVYVEILNHIKSLNPNVKFLLENVKMKKEYLDIISSYLEVEPLFINSNIVSAQNRQRYYWCNWDVCPLSNLDIRLEYILENIPEGTSEVRCGASRGRYLVNGVRQDGKMLTAGLTTQRLEIRKDFKTNCLTTVQKDNIVVFYNQNNEIISTRNLTVVECARLQGFPDNWCDVISKSQTLKAYGNSWTIPVIAHLFNNMINR